jgi:parvulin-like peptidyl-prolyl isomerase
MQRPCAGAAGSTVAVRSGVVLACAATLLAGCRSDTPTLSSSSRTTATQTRPEQREAGSSSTAAGPTTAPAEPVRIVATVNGLKISQADLYQPLVESYGLAMLQNVMLLKLAQQLTAQVHLIVTPADVQSERAGTLAGLFPDAAPSDYAGLLDQFLRTKNLSAVQFDLLVQTNANLRKVVALHMPVFTDDLLRQAFGQRYGENRVVRDIQVPNMALAAQAKRRVGGGEAFEKVATELSDDPRTRQQGGELPAFSNQAPNVPQAIKDAVFALKVGEVSDPVQDGTEYHILRLDGIIPPKVVKFEDVKADVRKTLEDQWVRFRIDQLRSSLAQVALQTIHIDDPALAAQWQKMLDRQQNRQRDREDIRQQLSKEHADANAPTSAVAATQAAAAATQAEKPPATMPGAASVPAAPGVPPAVQK